jgi:hypothetical protein
MKKSLLVLLTLAASFYVAIPAHAEDEVANPEMNRYLPGVVALAQECERRFPEFSGMPEKVLPSSPPLTRVQFSVFMKTADYSSSLAIAQKEVKTIGSISLKSNCEIMYSGLIKS